MTSKTMAASIHIKTAGRMTPPHLAADVSDVDNVAVIAGGVA